MKMQELFKVFSNFADLPAARRGAELAALFEHTERRSDAFMREAFESMLDVLELPKSHPLAEAGKVIAELIDSKSTEENYGGHGNGYHNRDHTFEVSTAKTGIVKIHEARGYEPKMDTEDKLVSLVSALIHDLGHNGKGNGLGRNRVPLMTEKHALELARPIIEAFYTDKDEFERVFAKIEAIVISTDIGGLQQAPGKFFAGYAAYHRGEIAAPPDPPLPELERFVPMLENNPMVAHQCALMQDADLLPSIGLTTGWAEKQNIRLAQEFPAARVDTGLDPEKALYFYDNIASLSTQAGREFLPNFQAIRAHAHDMCTEITEFKMSG